MACRVKRSAYRLCAAFSISTALILLLVGCATPVNVERSQQAEVRRKLASNVISTGSLGETTVIALRRQHLSDSFQADPDGTIARLYSVITAGNSESETFFALAALTFRRAEDTGKQPYFLAAAVYAFKYLFPEDPNQRPDPFDPRFRAACEIYNRSLELAFASADGVYVVFHSGRFELPFGSIDITFDSSGARWGDQTLSNFRTTDTVIVNGLDIRYWRPGIGASLAADVMPQGREAGFPIEPEVKVPVTALLRVDASIDDLAQGHLRGSVEVHPAFEPSRVMIGAESVPLEVDTSAAFAFSLSDPKVWASEFAGFLDGDFFDRSAAQLVGLEPYRPDQIPVVFIHGTGSSSGRWANLINDLQSDPIIREHFQFWSFSYATGNPVSYSAERLREAIEEAVQKLDLSREKPGTAANGCHRS